MMATYFNGGGGGGSEIQADSLQTLYLMNPSYADTPNALTHHAPHLVGIPLAPSGSDLAGGPLRFHYNLWGTAVNPDPSSSSGGGELGGFTRHLHQQKQGQLALSLNNSSPADMNASASGFGSPTSASGVSAGGGAQGVILGSKYLKAAQQLLDEVVDVCKMAEDSEAGGPLREKAKASLVSGEATGHGGAKKKGGPASEAADAVELSSAQRQELQMKKANLLNMLDEVEQRYRQYQNQMQSVASLLEQAAGSGSAKSYTALALHTISKQFRCLKDAITSQIKGTGRSLGEEEVEGVSRSGSRLRMVEQQLRQQRAMQHLGMMHNPANAWRPQRGLPERAVSVLRAWLFEHFLHPYPKDSDKHMLAKQTGLTRSQVSNWFINARVRLWKPMVEEMYVEEMKGALHQNDSDVDAPAAATTKNNNYPNKDSELLAPKSNPKPGPPPPNNFANDDIPNSTLISPPSGSTGPILHRVGPGFSLIGSSTSGLESMISPKRQRNTGLDIHTVNSSSSILSTDQDHGGFGLNNYPIADHIGSRFNSGHPHQQQLGQSRYHQYSGNGVSLTLGLPHGENLLSLSGTHHHHQQQNFLSGQAMQLGRRLDIGMGEPEWCPSQPGPHSGGGYEDIQTRKRFAAQLLPDFVA